MSVMLKPSSNPTNVRVSPYYCGCCGPMTKDACKREVVKTRRAVRHAEKRAWRKEQNDE